MSARKRLPHPRVAAGIVGAGGPVGGLALAAVLALAGGVSAGDTPPPSRSEALEAACLRLVAECSAARKAANHDPMVVEHPPGVLYETTSPAATRHVVNAIAIARDIRRRFGALPPACAQACDGLLK